MIIFILQIETEKNMPLIVKVAGINTAGNRPERRRRNKMRKGELTFTVAFYQDKGLWGYSLPELGLNFEGLTRNQAIMRATEKIRLCCIGPEDEVDGPEDPDRHPIPEDPDLSCRYTDNIYCRAAGQERGE